MRSYAQSTRAPRSSGSTRATFAPLEVDLGIFAQVAPTIPEGVPSGSRESGVRSPQDLLAYAASGADAVLVGEALVTHADPGAAVHDLVSGRGASSGPPRRLGGTKWICPTPVGISGRYGGRFVPEALVAAR